MVQATKLYQKYASAIALALGILLAMGFNVDSVEIVTPLPVGWNQQKFPTESRAWAIKGLEIFLTGVAASLGSPF